MTDLDNISAEVRIAIPYQKPYLIIQKQNHYVNEFAFDLKLYKS